MNIKNIQTVMKRMILLLGLAFTACTLEEPVIADSSGSMENETAGVSFSLAISSRMQMQTQTRSALSESDENAVLSVHLLMFKEINGVMTYYFSAKGNNIQSVSSSQKTFDATLPTGEYDVAILANAQDIIDKSGIAPGDTKESVLRALVERNAGKWNRNAIPMWGQIDRLTIHAGTGISNRNTVEMIRMLARIDVEIASSASGDFSLAEVRLYNYSSQGALAPGLAGAPVQPSVAGGYAPVAAPLIFDAGDGVTAGGCERIIYVCEAPAGSDANLSGNTCLVIGGSYKGGDVTYYRVDFVGMTNNRAVFLPIVRNNRYTVKVAGVSSSGHSTPEKALASPPVNMETAVLCWAEQDMNNVVFDGQNMLGVSTNRMTFSADEQTGTTAGNRLTVMSTVPEGWEIEKITDQSDVPGTATWLTVSVMSGMSGDVFVHVGKNTLSSERKGYLHIRSGALQYRVEVIQGTATGFGLEIIDPVTCREITVIDFSPEPGQTKSFRLVWKPATAGVAVRHLGTPFKGTGIPEDGATLTGGTATYTIETIEKEDASPWLTRLDFTLSDGVSTVTKTLLVRQK
jgi:hypothetical protein